MSTLPDNEFDLEKLFLPAWAQGPASTKSYENYEGETPRFERSGDRRGPRPPRREGGPGPRRDENRPRGDRRGPRRPEGGRDRGPGGAPAGGGERPGPRRFERPERREPPPPLPELRVSLVPDEKGVESLARQIRMTGRAYPLFDIAQMILQKPERHTVSFGVMKNAEGQVIQAMFLCVLDDSLWLSEDEAVGHVLRKHFGTFYQAERTPTEPPKGKYTFVAQCGMSGIVLGPPNHHDYQTQLRKLHAERFSRMPFEVYKARVRIVRDEEVVKKWVDDQSWKTEYICLNMPDALKLPNMEAVEKHFRENHKDNIIKSVEDCTLSGTAARNLRTPQLTRLVRSVWEDQKRFPLQIATVLSQQFAGHGLQFFKVNRTVTHVSVARPHFLDLEATPVSEGVKRIVDFINAHPKSTRRHLIEALAPAPPAPPAPAVVPVPVEGQAAPAPAPAPEPPQATPEQTALVADLHWLVHQGHVIEFANGILETAKRPLPKPPKPEPKAAPAAAPAAAAEAATGATAEVAPASPEAQATEAAVPASPETPSVPAAESAPAETIAEPAPAAETQTPAPEPPAPAPAAETPAPVVPEPQPEPSATPPASPS